MKLDTLSENEKLHQKLQDKINEDGHSKKFQSEKAFEDRVNENLCVKASMVTELVEMGFSLDAIERILNLKPEVLDRLL